MTDDQAAKCEKNAAKLRLAIMDLLWDNVKRAFTNSLGKMTLYPQDENVIALACRVVKPDNLEAKQVLDYLASNWGERGSEVPELPSNISLFMPVVELKAHFCERRPDHTQSLYTLSPG
ncbi:unnamed protein product [Clonostachys rosea]|uniref:Uncharacterized protein n=1 Tax=Bionectria ochroleuca TaxID=29856 RepID=A0ABY6U3X7_BIOOC|nr:unnamed protein product [Clonostachys rosea]